MARTRILVVDDSAVARRLVSEAIATDPSLELVGSAPNGRLALARLEQLKPDVITLDLEMPEMDGLATLIEVRKSHPHLPVIMFSSLTERGGLATLEAIAHGASDYLMKPDDTASIDETRKRIVAELLPRIRAFAPPGAASSTAAARAAPARAEKAGAEKTGAEKAVNDKPIAAASRPARPSARVEVLAIGVSTGGPIALEALIPKLPKDLPVPVLVVQHMPPVFTRLLAERLGRNAALPVRECEGDELLHPGQVFIAKGDHHMIVRGPARSARLALNQAPPENSCRPSVDVLFRSVAEVYGPAALVVVLTGMGQDGLRGCEMVREAGGQIVVQDQASSVIWGMPGAVARRGLADRILPLDQLASELTTLILAGRSQRGRASGR